MAYADVSRIVWLCREANPPGCAIANPTNMMQAGITCDTSGLRFPQAA